jgi:hypothetical protein
MLPVPAAPVILTGSDVASDNAYVKSPFSSYSFRPLFKDFSCLKVRPYLCIPMRTCTAQSTPCSSLFPFFPSLPSPPSPSPSPSPSPPRPSFFMLTPQGMKAKEYLNLISTQWAYISASYTTRNNTYCNNPARAYGSKYRREATEIESPRDKERFLN